jgi:hypothetical protein
MLLGSRISAEQTRSMADLFVEKQPAAAEGDG